MCLFFISPTVYAAGEYGVYGGGGVQDNSLFFRNMAQFGGLGYNGAGSIAEDTDGCLWLATGDDILRFDGYASHSYKEKFEKSGRWLVHFNALHVTRNGELYAVGSAGLFRYVPDADDFELLYERPFRNIYEDAEGVLWLSNSYIVRFDTKTLTPEPLLNDGREVLGQLYASQESYCVYILTNDGLLSLDIRTGERIWKGHPFLHKQVAAMCLCDTTLFVLTQKSGLYAGCGDVWTSLTELDYEGHPVTARKLLADGRGTLWISSMQGLFSYRIADGSLSHYVQSRAHGALPNNSIHSLFLDSRGNLWIGTYAGGLCFVALETGTVISEHCLRNDGLADMPVSAMLRTGDTLWVGTEGAGLLCYAKGKGLLRHYTRSTDHVMRSDNIKALSMTDGRLWIGTYLGGLLCLDTRTGRLTEAAYGSGEGRLPSRQVYCMCSGPDGCLWLIFQDITNVLARLDTRTGVITTTLMPEPVGEYTSDRLYRIVSGHGCLWLSTGTSIYCFSLAENVCLYSATIDSHAWIQDICYDDARNCLWLATRKSGLMKYDIATRRFSVAASMAHDHEPWCHTLCLNGDEVWLGSGSGIWVYDIMTGRQEHFASSSGVSSRLFCCTVADSVVYMGGEGVWNECRRSDMHTEDDVPHVIISDLRVNGKSVSAVSDGDKNRIAALRRGRLILGHDENNISILLAAGDCANADRYSYRFRFRPKRIVSRKAVSREWQLVGESQRQVSLFNIPKGDWLFEAQSAYAGDRWSDSVCLDIRVQPVWYAGAWALAGYAMLAVLLLAAVTRLLISRYRLRRSLYETGIRNQEEEKASRAKVRFFTDVSKEIKAPLLTLQSLVDPSHVPYVQQILRSMDKYVQKYCIDTSSNPQAVQRELQLDKLTELIDVRIADGRVNIDMLAADMGMSRRKLFSFVKDTTGKSPIEYIRSYRIQTAAKLMIEKGLSIQETMDAVGIESQSYFVKSFRLEFGKSPTEFLRHHRPQ